MSIYLRTVSNELLINTITDTFISIQAISLRARQYKVSDLGSIQQQQTTSYFFISGEQGFFTFTWRGNETSWIEEGQKTKKDSENRVHN